MFCLGKIRKKIIGSFYYIASNHISQMLDHLPKQSFHNTIIQNKSKCIFFCLKPSSNYDTKVMY